MASEPSESAPQRPTELINVTVNGDEIEREVEPRLKLSDFLRNHAGLNGVRLGCEHGVCGACMVRIDGQIAKSCLMYAVQVDGKEILTVEGIADEENLHPLQEAFHEEHALQCGFCTGGFIISAYTLLEKNPDPSREEIKQALSSNICRCTGYQNIYEAIETAAKKIQSQ